MGRHTLRRRGYGHGLLDGLMAAWAVAFTVAWSTGRWMTAERVLAVLGLGAVLVLIFIVWRAR